MDFTYKPDGETVKQFLLDDGFFRGLRGPVGSGKSVACCIEIFRRASQQAPAPDGKRYTRFAIIRNTNPQLKTTTIKTWLDWFPEEAFGRFNWSPPYTHHIKKGDIDCEIIFLALDRPEEIRKLLSLELTGIFINEAREVSKAIVDGCTMRVGRYPSMKIGGPSWYGVFADTNAPDDDHWWPIMAGEAPLPDYISTEEALMLQKPQNWNFYTQPPGMLEVKNESTGAIQGYEMNPDAENVSNLHPTYYNTTVQGKTKGWIDVYVMNRLGSLDDGKPIYPMFAPETHVSRETITYSDSLPIYVGIDFGLTPAAVFAQQASDGRWLIIREVVTTDMGAARFSEVLRTQILKDFPTNEMLIYADPAGDQRAQTDEATPFQILRANGVNAFPAPSNDPIVRIESVTATLTRMVDGKPGLLLDPSCAQLRKGFASGYQYKRMQVSGEARYDLKPNKNKYSHVHDALQYLMLGGGEGRKLITGGRTLQTFSADRSFNVFDRNKRKGRSWGKSAGMSGL